MEVHADRLAKRYRRQWVFRNLSLHVKSGESWAITGPNGSGKSTLLKVLTGVLPQSEGQVAYLIDGKALGGDAVYRHLSFAAPYADLIDEMTVEEVFTFHRQFRNFAAGIDLKAFVCLLGAAFSHATVLKEMSSGMKQRVRIALALCTESALIVLDEPTTNLDEQGKAWYDEMLDRFVGQSTLLIASNVESDLSRCAHRLNVLDYSSAR